MELESKLKIDDIVRNPNIAEELSEDDLKTIGEAVWSDWFLDKTSRFEWEEKTAGAMKLALQVTEQKTFPWENASNVKFPLITIAALQYQSRAYPSLIPGVDVVKCRVVGTDTMGEKQARADRVSQFMSYQVLEEDEKWEENMDKALIAQAIVGCAFKKSYFDPVLGHNVSEHVLAKDLYISYFAPSLEKATRITHILYMTKNDVLEKVRKGLFLELNTSEPTVVETSNPLEVAKEEAQGLFDPVNDPSAPREFLEQHRFLDLDGDGYEEPYIVTVDRETQQVVRIVARFNTSSVEKRKGKIASIVADQYFTKFPFIPSPDGGIYDLGFGVLLGPLNESINTILNQLVDAGTLSNTAGGFLGRGVKFRSGDNSFRPFEWKRVDSTGDDLAKGIFPLPVREPSPVLFNLLSLLIDYGERIGMAVDPLVGINPGQNTPAETSRNMLAEGQRIFNAVFKRTHRSLKEEFRKLYKLNYTFLNERQDFYSLLNEGSNVVFQVDFAGDVKDIVPASDPNMVSDEQRIQQALAIKTASETSPGYNKYNVEKRFLQALKVTDIESILPDPSGPNALPPPPPDSKVLIESMKIQQQKMEFEKNLQLKIFDLMQEVEYLRSEIVEKETRAALNLAQAEGVKDNLAITALQTSVATAKAKQDGLLKVLEVLRDLKIAGQEKEIETDGNNGGVGGASENSGS